MSRATLLRQIADALGLDAEAFDAAIEVDAPLSLDPIVSDSNDVGELRRLIIAFYALPTQETRIRAVHLIEALVAEASDRTSDDV